MRSPCCLYVYPHPHNFCYDAYEIILLSVCVCVPINFFFPYAVRVVSEKRGRLVLPRNSCHCVYEECSPVACDAVWLTFRRKALPQSSGLMCKSRKQTKRAARKKNLVQNCHTKLVQRETTGASEKTTRVGPLKGHIWINGKMGEVRRKVARVTNDAL
jgi:hypothetical protein